MPQENLAGRSIAGYRLLERVGEGGTATVYRAEHDTHGRCAVKTLRERLRHDPTAVKRFLREAGYGARVRHPNVVRTYEYGDQDGVYYLALEWAEGEPLAEVVAREGRLPLPEVVHLVSQLADALAAAHSVGIIHRDLKPENIMYHRPTRTAKLLDFGIARDAQQDPSERLTRTGFFVGTLQYVAPEALSGELVGEAADIYSLATITYYLLTGRHPYSGSSPRELFQQLLNQSPTPLNQAVRGLKFPKGVEEAVMKGLARDPSKRQRTVLDFAAELRSGAEGAPAAHGERGLLDRLWLGLRRASGLGR
jgi:serine/threonine protein kinase